MNGAAPGACRSTEPQGRRGPWTRILLIGVLGGTGLGGVARAWMRLIADKPEFTWTGTLFIVGGFTVFGAGQALVAIARRGTYPRWRLTMVRLLGLAAAAPLFVAAGALLFPTVAGGGLALSRTDWSPGMRAGAVLVTTGPVAYVGRDLTQKFGWSLHTAAGFTAMVAIYAVIVAASRFTLAPQLDGWGLTRTGKLAASAITAVGVGSLLLIGGFEA